MRKQRAETEVQIRGANGDPTDALAGFDEATRAVKATGDKLRAQFDQVLRDLETRCYA